MSEEKTYRFRLKMGDCEVEFEGDKEWIEKKLSVYEKKFIAKSRLESDSIKPESVKKDESKKPHELPDNVAQFYREKGEPRKHLDRVMVFAYWLTKMEDMESYNITDILKCYDNARVKKPSNISDIMNKVNPELLLIAPDKDDKKAWKISFEGDKYVENMGKSD